MLTNKAHLLFCLLAISSLALSQGSDYILKQETFKEPATIINISPDGQKLLAGFNNGAFRILNINTMETEVEVENAHPKAVYALELSPKMDFLLSAGHNSIKLWNPEGEQITNWKSHATTIWNVDISKDGKYAVSSEFNKTFRLWDVYKSEVIEQMRGHEDVTMAVAISEDSKFIASGSNDLSIKIWDIESRQCIKTLHGPTKDIYDVKFSPDGKLVAAASKDESVRIYNIADENLVHLLKGHRDFVIEVEFSPDGRYLISASADQSIALWSVESGERIYTYLENEAALIDISFHPDGSSFFSSSMDNKITRWSLDPEIFVLKYFESPYSEEISGNHLFDERRKSESRKDYESRIIRADKKRKEIVDRYYQLYLERFNQQSP